jgi:hypothetical protein
LVNHCKTNDYFARFARKKAVQFCECIIFKPMKKILFLITLFSPLSISALFAQKKADFTVEFSSDTVGLDGSLEIVFTLENAKLKKINPPSFEGFDVQGPSTSSMTSIVNGEMSQKMSYTFYLTPSKIGHFTIGEASVELDKGVLTTEKRDIQVVEHYESKAKPKRRNFFDEDGFFNSRPKQRAPEKEKKKYETERI